MTVKQMLWRFTIYILYMALFRWCEEGHYVEC